MPTISSTMGELIEVEPQSTSSAPTASSTSDAAQGTITSNPSLILAFLALSFFTLAMVFIFGFRRYQFFQERLHEVFGRPGADPNRPSELQAAGEIRLRRLPGTRPKLWDVCTDTSVRWREVRTKGIRGRRTGGEDDEDALWSWDNVMPLSASKATNTDELGKVPVSSSRCPNVFQRFWATDKNSRHPTSVSAMSRLRLAVVIAMPSERFPIYDREFREDRFWHERGTLEYELGLHELPWDEDG